MRIFFIVCVCEVRTINWNVTTHTSRFICVECAHSTHTHTEKRRWMENCFTWRLCTIPAPSRSGIPPVWNLWHILHICNICQSRIDGIVVAKSQRRPIQSRQRQRERARVNYIRIHIGKWKYYAKLVCYYIYCAHIEILVNVIIIYKVTQRRHQSWSTNWRSNVIPQTERIQFWVMYASLTGASDAVPNRMTRYESKA